VLQSGEPGFDTQLVEETFVFVTHSVQTASGCTQPPIQWAPGTLLPGSIRPGRAADNSPRSGVEVNNGGRIPPRPLFIAWCLLIQSVHVEL
jgi:hypothetical protein